MKKVYSLFLLMATLAFVAVSCKSDSDRAKNELEKMAKEANEDCPFSIGMVGEITSIEFDGQNLVFYASADEDFVDLDVLEQNPELAKEGAFQSLFSNADADNTKKLMEELEKANAGLRVVYKGQTSGRTVSFTISYDELKKRSDNPSEAMDPDEFLEQNVRVTNNQCPVAVETGIVMQEVFVEGSNVVYLYSMDEDLYDIDQMNENRSEAQALLDDEIRNLERDPAGKSFLDACRNAHKNIIYRYVGSASGKSVDFFVNL